MRVICRSKSTSGTIEDSARPMKELHSFGDRSRSTCVGHSASNDGQPIFRLLERMVGSHTEFDNRHLTELT